MTKRKTNEISPIVGALLNPSGNEEATAFIEKEHAITRTKATVYKAISCWVGEEVADGEAIPIVRNGKNVGSLPTGLFGIGPVERVTEASKALNRTELKEKVDRLSKVASAAESLISHLDQLTGMEKAEIDIGRSGLARDRSLPLESRLIREIGNVAVGFIVCSAIKSEAEDRKNMASTTLAETRKDGRPRNEAAYAVALELAKLYAKITGKRPTYSEDMNGVSGDFTPALRDVFNSLGWEKNTLSGPATEAVKQITEQDMDHPETSGLGGLLGLSRS